MLFGEQMVRMHLEVESLDCQGGTCPMFSSCGHCHGVHGAPMYAPTVVGESLFLYVLTNTWYLSNFLKTWQQKLVDNYQNIQRNFFIGMWWQSLWAMDIVNDNSVSTDIPSG